MKRHSMLMQGLTIAGLIMLAVTLAIVLLYWTGMDFRS